jgi:hypothetical protein
MKEPFGHLFIVLVTSKIATYDPRMRSEPTYNNPGMRTVCNEDFHFDNFGIYIIMSSHVI